MQTVKSILHSTEYVIVYTGYKRLKLAFGLICISCFYFLSLLHNSADD